MSEEMKKELSEQEKEMLAKLAQAKTVDDVLAVAKEYGKEISEEEAKKTLEEINKFRASGKASGELSDDDLDNVAGGAWYDTKPSEWTQQDWADYRWLGQMIWGPSGY